METSKETINETVQKFKHSLLSLKDDQSHDQKQGINEGPTISKEIIEIVIQLKNILKSSKSQSTSVNKTKEISNAFITQNILTLLPDCYPAFDSHIQKDITYILSYVIESETEYLFENPMFISTLLKGSIDNLFYLHTLSVCAKYKRLGEVIHKSKAFLNLFKAMKSSKNTTFLNKTSSDFAFEIVEKVIHLNKEVFSKYIEYHYNFFLAQYFEVFALSDTVKKKKALSLLKEILMNLDYEVKMKFLNDVSNMQIILNALKMDNNEVQQGSVDILNFFLLNPSKANSIVKFIKENGSLFEVIAENDNIEEETKNFILEKVNLIKMS